MVRRITLLPLPLRGLLERARPRLAWVRSRPRGWGLGESKTQAFASFFRRRFFLVAVLAASLAIPVAVAIWVALVVIWNPFDLTANDARIAALQVALGVAAFLAALVASVGPLLAVQDRLQRPVIHLDAEWTHLIIRERERVEPGGELRRQINWDEPIDLALTNAGSGPARRANVSITGNAGVRGEPAENFQGEGLRESRSPTWLSDVELNPGESMPLGSIWWERAQPSGTYWAMIRVRSGESVFDFEVSMTPRHGLTTPT